MAKSKIHAIRCTQCGSSIDLFGGHNVESIICPSCNSCLDGKDEYKVIATYLSKVKKAPKLPLKIGMKGVVKGVEFTVIGYIRYIEDGEKYYEFQIFSPTHGYAWLTREELYFVFSREVKDMPNDANLMDLSKGQKITVKGMEFLIIEKGYEKIDYVAGELTWRGRLGDGESYITGVKPPYLYTISREKNELTFTFGEYIEKQKIYAAFGIKEKVVKSPDSSLGTLGKQPRIIGYVLMPFLLSFLLCLALALYSIFMCPGKKIYTTTIPCKALTEGKVTKEFQVNTPHRLILVKLNCNFNNAWGFFNVSVRQGDEEFLNITKEIAYYSGYEGGESWSEGSQSADAYIRLPEKGKYQLYIEGEGGYGASGKGFKNQDLTVSVYENIMLSRYFIIATVIFGLITFISFSIWRNKK